MPIKFKINVDNGQIPLNYIIYPNINKSDNITGILDNIEDTLFIDKSFYNKPGIYIARVIIQDNAGNIGEKEIIINYYQPYLPEPIVGIHGFMGHAQDYYDENYKYIFNFLRGGWDENNLIYNGGYDLVCVANDLGSDTARIKDQYPKLIKQEWDGDSSIYDGYLVGYDFPTTTTANNTYDKYFTELKDQYRKLRWIPLAKKMWRYTFLRRYGALPEDFGLPENPKVALLAGSMGGLVARA